MYKRLLVLLLLLVLIGPLAGQSIMTKITTGNEYMEGIDKPKFDWLQFNVTSNISAGKLMRPKGSVACSNPSGPGHVRGGGTNIFVQAWLWVISLFSCGESDGSDNTEVDTEVIVGSGYSITGNSSTTGTAVYGSGTVSNSGGNGTTGSGSGGTIITAPSPQIPVLIKDIYNNPEADNTLQITKLPCNTNVNAKSNDITNIWNAVKNTPEIKDAMNKAPTRKYEVGCTISKISFGNSTNYLATNYDTTTKGSTVIHIPTMNTDVADFHVHPEVDTAGKTNVDNPSSGDIYAVIHLWNHFSSHPFQTSYVHSGDSNRNTYAVNIDDTIKASHYFHHYPKSGYIVIDSSQEWQGNNKKYSPDYYFQSAKNFFVGKNCSENDAIKYADAYVMDAMGMGAKMYQQDKNDGVFKQIQVTPIKDSNGKAIGFTVNICQ